MSGVGVRRALVIAASAALAGVLALAAWAAPVRQPGNVRVLVRIPSPGFPALPHVVGTQIFEGTYDDPAGDHLPSRVFQYTPAGKLVRSWSVKGQDLSQPHGVQVAANDARGRLILLDKTSGRIIRLNPRTGSQTLYSRVPDLPTCIQARREPCSPESQNLAPMPDYAAWGPDGSLYVTDYQQAVIWRIPPGGGRARIWLVSPRLDGGTFGTACIVLLPDHHTLLFDQASNGDVPGTGTSPSTGKLYRVPINPDGQSGALKQLWESGPADAPDGCVLSRSGHIYLALAGASNQIVELSSSGQVLARFGQKGTGANNSTIPYDTPSGLAWLGTDLIVANQAYLDQNTSNMALLDVASGERGRPAYVPRRAGLPPGP